MRLILSAAVALAVLALTPLAGAFGESPAECEPLRRHKASREAIRSYQGTAVLVRVDGDSTSQVEFFICHDDATNRTRFDFAMTTLMEEDLKGDRPNAPIRPEPREEKHLLRHDDHAVERWFAKSRKKAEMEIFGRSFYKATYKAFDPRVVGSDLDFSQGLSFSGHWKSIEGGTLFGAESDGVVDTVGFARKLGGQKREVWLARVLEIDSRKGDCVTSMKVYAVAQVPASLAELAEKVPYETTTTLYSDFGGAWMPTHTRRSKRGADPETPDVETVDFRWELVNVPVDAKRFERGDMFDWRGGEVLDYTAKEAGPNLTFPRAEDPNP